MKWIETTKTKVETILKKLEKAWGKITWHIERTKYKLFGLPITEIRASVLINCHWKRALVGYCDPDEETARIIEFLREYYRL
ncbi:hypothetical protein Pogu_2143 [Pyrobaculum oguniense TE7]|uniref:Uncharacterized protein n=1 Tax=Pyrobaculum oguniense (strain DSM 13380 / JCM 10595 / TE7) TaxID=698757 RepID=H6QCX1_PYROT|nr:hypothetical protein Pogu_2143 [Pyrobaculum oguniense TE7]